MQCGRPGFDPWVRKMPWRREQATHSSILAWRIPWTEEPGGLQSMGLQKSDPTEQLTLSLSLTSLLWVGAVQCPKETSFSHFII